MNFNKKISDTSIRIGEVRFSFAHVFSPRKGDDGSPAKYGVQLLIPKSDTEAVRLIKEAAEAAKKIGPKTGWGNKTPAAIAKLQPNLRDGDEENPDDPTYAGMWFINANTGLDRKPGVCVLENGSVSDALDEEDFYSGCYGAATISMFAYNTSGNTGIACALNNVIRTRHGERLAGGRTADQDFGDLTGASCLD